MPKINAAGLMLIKQFEGCRLTAYQDAVGVWTIGWGHTPATEGQTITQEQADALLEQDLQGFEECVNDLTDRNLTPNQFAALVSFAYNEGCGALGSSTLMRYVNAGNFADAANEFGKWIEADGVVLQGLVRRRAAERELFLAP
jgi:lysozyme